MQVTIRNTIEGYEVSYSDMSLLPGREAKEWAPTWKLAQGLAQSALKAERDHYRMDEPE